MGILSILDEESRFPKATDLTFLEKCHTNQAKSEGYVKPKMMGVNYFGVVHYAGEVTYVVDGWLEKNRDSVFPELLKALLSSGDRFLRGLFADQAEPAAGSDPARGKPGTMSTIKSTKGPSGGGGGGSVGSRFKSSLQDLMDTLNATDPSYVRCIKPNALKVPTTFDSELVLAQLRYSGMLETVAIRKSGYPRRFQPKEFFDRYAFIIKGICRADSVKAPYLM